MQHSTRLEHRWTLDEPERFDWDMRRAYKDHRFTVERVEADFRDGEIGYVYFVGPWVDAPADGKYAAGWATFYVDLPEDADALRQAPAAVVDALRSVGVDL